MAKNVWVVQHYEGMNFEMFTTKKMAMEYVVKVHGAEFKIDDGFITSTEGSGYDPLGWIFQKEVHVNTRMPSLKQRSNCLNRAISNSETGE